jgi:hypothetical protein
VHEGEGSDIYRSSLPRHKRLTCHDPSASAPNPIVELSSTSRRCGAAVVESSSVIILVERAASSKGSDNRTRVNRTSSQVCRSALPREIRGAGRILGKPENGPQRTMK